MVSLQCLLEQPLAALPSLPRGVRCGYQSSFSISWRPILHQWRREKCKWSVSEVKEVRDGSLYLPCLSIHDTFEIDFQLHITEHKEVIRHIAIRNGWCDLWKFVLLSWSYYLFVVIELLRVIDVDFDPLTHLSRPFAVSFSPHYTTGSPFLFSLYVVRLRY